MDKFKLAELLHEMALYLDLLGENPFKVRAHDNASRIIETYQGDLEADVKSGAIGEVRGIGPALKEKIEEFQKTGKITEHDKLQKKIPAGLLNLLKIPGLGPKKVKVIYDELGCTTVGELEYACRENRLRDLKGFGEKTQVKILQNIEFLKKHQNEFLYSDAQLESVVLSGFLKGLKGVKKLLVCGSLRRRKETVHDIDIVVAADDGINNIMKKFSTHPSVESITGSGETKTSVVLKNGMACDLRVVSPKEFPYAVMYFTGNKDHNTALRQIAKDKSMKLNEYGLFKLTGKTEKLIPCSSEEEIYNELGMKYIEPELRENQGEIEAAQKKALPVLVEREQLKGVFHCHTVDSDGVNTLEEMVAGAQNLGFEYIGISDHSATAAYANGLKKDRVLEQFKRIEALQKKFKIRIFKGIESDILSDGSLDYDDAILKKFDFVIGSLHSSFQMPEEEMNKRMMKAMKCPYLDFIGHPTARLLLAREGVHLNMHKVIEEAAKTGVVVELNAHPQRLDMDWRLGKFLKEKGARVSINPDAHSVAGLEDVDYGVGIARKGWLSPENVLNTLPANKVLGALRRAKAAARA